MAQPQMEQTQARAQPWVEALAVFDGRGWPEAVDPEFLSVVGSLLERPALEAPERFWLRHGFVPVDGARDTFDKGGRRYVCSLRAVQGRLLARLLDVTDAEQGRAARRKLLSVAAHDLRGPLANVRSYASLLLGPHLQQDERTRRGLQVVERNADRALHLVNGLFDLFRSEVGLLSTDPEPQSLLPLLRAAEAGARERAGRQEVGIETDYPAELPDLPLDAERLEPALATFWSNALTRTGAGQSIGSFAEELPTQVRVGFWDHGPVLSGEEMAHAFDADFVVPRRSRLDQGFELCVAAAAIRAHGGTVAVVQDPARTTFSFSLPKAGR